MFKDCLIIMIKINIEKDNIIIIIFLPDIMNKTVKNHEKINNLSYNNILHKM